MKKTVISLLTIIMFISFACLLGLQIKYIDEIVTIRKENFDEAVNKSLYRTVYKMDVKDAELQIEIMNSLRADSLDQCDVIDSCMSKDTSNNVLIYSCKDVDFGDLMFKSEVQGNEGSVKDNKILDEVLIRDFLRTNDKRSIEECLDIEVLDQMLQAELHNNGIDIPYHFIVTTSSGREVFRCSDYDSEGAENCYSVPLYKNSHVSKMGTLKVHFPDMRRFIFDSLWYIVPSLLFTMALFGTFVVTIVLLFRQKKISEVKNDFINNMTHEFKTPISTISLAAQMLGDDSVNKSQQMYKRLSSTIIDETKRLRFQVEKVLQLSMYDQQKANLKMKEVNANELITSVVKTFALKVEKNSGKIITDLKAENPMVLVDDMHFTNVVFNLLDNAVKYRRADSNLELKITTWNESDKLCISIQDNGIGIKKDDLKKIFDKFFRVHTGNVHDVKGFGLGLAYVKKIINDHRGCINVDSEIGIGTKFIIKVPVC